MVNLVITFLGKAFVFFTKKTKLGSGSTWPGHIALKLNSKFIKQILARSKTKIIIICGTNGKTTTGKLIAHLLSSNDKRIIHNEAGANLLNGLASTLIKGSSLGELNADYLIFETDENVIPYVLESLTPDYIICLNLFRDQLDRYGEIDSISRKWSEAFKKLDERTILILNSDDPTISYLDNDTKAKALYFGLEEAGSKQTSHGADSIYCPRCNNKLKFSKVYFSHLGIWNCTSCNLERKNPNLSSLDYFPLSGTYNKYNTLASSLLAKAEGLTFQQITNRLNSFTPAFGRQEKILYRGKNVQIFLSKNPTSFNESLQTVKELGGKNLLILLNDRIPDGLDVSWIWDINFEEKIEKYMNIAVSGDRVWDMALRFKYGNIFAHHNENSETALNQMVDQLEAGDTLYILANYSAMLDIRKIITGKKIL